MHFQTPQPNHQIIISYYVFCEMLAFKMIPINLSHMKLVGRGEKDWKQKINRVSKTLSKEPKDQKNKKILGLRGEGSFWQYLASLLLYTVGGAIVLFIRDIRGCEWKTIQFILRISIFVCTFKWSFSVFETFFLHSPRTFSLYCLHSLFFFWNGRGLWFTAHPYNAFWREYSEIQLHKAACFPVPHYSKGFLYYLSNLLAG